MNLPGDNPNDLVIGVPTRYAIEGAWPAFRSNWLLTSIALSALTKNYGGLNKFISNPTNLQDGIEFARKARAASLKQETAEDKQ